MATGTARIGTSGWNKPQWRGHFYPRGLVQRSELEYASARFGSLEINNTFHALSSPSNFPKWREGTPDDFVFAVKGHRLITHEHLLRNPARGIAEFFASGVLELREKLGPVLWQVPPTLPFQPDVVETFLASLPHSVDEARHLAGEHGGAVDPELPDRAIRHSFEFRNPSFENPVFAELLRLHGVAVVATDPVFREPTADFVYARLHANADHHPNGYDDATLDRWAQNIERWASGGRNVFAYFDNHDDTATRPPFDALRLQERLGIAPPASDPVQPPLWEE